MNGIFSGLSAGSAHDLAVDRHHAGRNADQPGGPGFGKYNIAVAEAFFLAGTATSAIIMEVREGEDGHGQHLSMTAV